MKIFLAGGVSGNLKPFWKDACSYLRNGMPYENAVEETMRIFLAGGEGRHWIQDTPIQNVKKNSKCKYFSQDRTEYTGSSNMELFIAGNWPWRRGGGYDLTVKEYKPYILESFYYADEDTERLLPYFGDFLLDSGAFTFMQGRGAPNWDEYIEMYADFIKRNKVMKYFELDVDSVVGYDRVIRFRNKLEKLVGWPSIPVWHKSRGMEEYLKMCDQYDYVAVGGIVSKEIRLNDYWIFTHLINEAHKRGSKIHGLGFTNLDGMRKYHFDSVDSTSWTIGNRFGKIYKFDGKTMIHFDKPKGKRLADSRAVALNNFVEWLKFQKYAEVHL